MRKTTQDKPMQFASAGPGSRPGNSPSPATADRHGDSVTTGLQQLFASIAEEPIPDDFLRLLDDIDASSARSPVPGDRA